MVKLEFTVRQVALVSLLVVIGVITLFATGVFDSAANVPAPGGSIGNSGTGEVQDVTLRISNFQYVTVPAVLKANVPVRMTVDLSSVQGCARAVTIPEFGVRQVVQSGNNIISFTPTKSGKFAIACSMNMYKGVLVVE